MPWLIGIDEAGYGPNLGPLVMSAVACRLPDARVGADLWSLLRAAVRRPNEADDGRLLVEDSKVVYSPARGLQALEIGVHAALPPPCEASPLTLTGYLAWLSPPAAQELADEPWYSGTGALPVAAEADVCQAGAFRFAEASRVSEMAWPLVRSVVMCPRRYNRIVQEWGSKGAALGQGLTELLQAVRAAAGGDETLYFCVDKHGGRNTYAAMLQDAIPDGMVLAQEESMARSTYQVHGAGQTLRFTFQPRADAQHFCVALASMVSKYLREVLMAEFNRFWQSHVPGLKPTAGYPVDASRFLEAIRPTITRLGIAEPTVWRCK